MSITTAQELTITEYGPTVDNSETKKCRDIWYSFDDLYELFGLPFHECCGHNHRCDRKTDAEWRLKFSNGVIIRIYNYKDGFNYLGVQGTRLSELTCWSLSGYPQEQTINTLEQYINAKTDLLKNARKRELTSEKEDLKARLKRVRKELAELQ